MSSNGHNIHFWIKVKRAFRTLLKLNAAAAITTLIESPWRLLWKFRPNLWPLLQCPIIGSIPARFLKSLCFFWFCVSIIRWLWYVRYEYPGITSPAVHEAVGYVTMAEQTATARYLMPSFILIPVSISCSSFLSFPGLGKVLRSIPYSKFPIQLEILNS